MQLHQVLEFARLEAVPHFRPAAQHAGVGTRRIHQHGVERAGRRGVRFTQQVRLDDGDLQPFGQRGHGRQAIGVDVAGDDVALVLHQFGQVRGLAAGGAAQVQHGHAGFDRQFRGDELTGVILHAELAGVIAGNVPNRHAVDELEGLRRVAGFAADAAEFEHLPERFARQVQGVDAQPDRRHGVEVEREAERFGVLVAAQQPIGEPRRQAEPESEVIGGGLDGVGQHFLGHAAVAAVVGRDGVHVRLVQEFVGRRLSDATQDAVEEALGLGPADVLGQFHRLVHRRVFGHLIQHHQLIGAQSKHVAPDRFDLVPRPGNVRANQRVQRGGPPHDPENERGHQAAVGAGQDHARQQVVDEVRQEAAAFPHRGQQIEGQRAGGGERSGHDER